MQQRDGSSGGSSRRRSPRGIALAVTGLLVLTLVACGGDDDATSTDDGREATSGQEATDLLGAEDAASGEPVKIGMVGDGQTQAYDNRDELRAAQAAGEFWNEHRGGVAGRPVEVVTCETGGDPAGGADCANQLVEQDVVAVAISQSAVTDSVWQPLHDAGVPTMILQASGDALFADDENTFALANPFSTLFAVPVALAGSEGTDKIAFVNIDVPQANASFDSGEAQDLLDNAGLDYELVKIPPGTADMTSQMQEVANSGAGVAYVVGNDAFCIAAFQGLNTVGFTGSVAAVSQCITDATRDALPDQLEGISITATMAVGDTDDSKYQLYQAVMGTYGDAVEDVDNALGMGGYTVMSSLLASLAELEGDVTPESVTAAIKEMPETEYPGADGVTFQCGGGTFPSKPAVCTNQSLRAALDADGQPASYEAIDSTDDLAGL